MITKEKFESINQEVASAIDDLLDMLSAISTENYVLFLASGEYVEKVDI